MTQGTRTRFTSDNAWVEGAAVSIQGENHSGIAETLEEPRAKVLATAPVFPGYARCSERFSPTPTTRSAPTAVASFSSVSRVGRVPPPSILAMAD